MARNDYVDVGDRGRALATLVVERRRRLRLTQQEAAATSAGTVSVATWRNLEKGTQERYTIRALHGVGQVLRWRSDALEQFLTGKASLHGLINADLEPEADAEALRSGHGGSEGWPPWLEAKFSRVEEDVARHGRLLEELRQEIGRLRGALDAGRVRSQGE